MFSAWQTHIRPDGVSIFAPEAGREPNDDELRQWRLWFVTVFLPNVQKARQIVVEKADLLVESTMPPVLLDLCAHVAACETLVARWNDGDHSDHLAIVHYPGAELMEYAETSFQRLKQQQARLLGGAR